ncbi:MAG: DUF3368 domain-containing protein [Thermoproteota archaeon]
MPIVSNASPLIWLSKVGELSLLEKLFSEVLIPEEVYKEVVEKGLEEGFSDAFVIKESVDNGWVKVVKLAEDEEKLCEKIVEHAPEIHLGEAQAIILARENKTLLLIDESSGRAFAEAMGLKARGTLYIIIEALRKGLLEKNNARETVLTLAGKGFRIEPKLLARLLREIEK